jgi:hypothetical protein
MGMVHKKFKTFLQSACSYTGCKDFVLSIISGCRWSLLHSIKQFNEKCTVVWDMSPYQLFALCLADNLTLNKEAVRSSKKLVDLL